MMDRSGSRGDARAHVDLERLLAYAHGEIDGDAADEVLRHGLSCRECGDELGVMLALTGRRPAIVAVEDGGGAAAIGPVAAEDDPAGVRPWRWTGLAAAAMVVALICAAIWWSQRPNSWPDEAPATADAPGPADAPGTADAPGASAAARLATVEPPEAIMTGFLFTGEVAERADDARAGFTLLVNRRYEEAVAYLTPRQRARPDDGEIAAVLGIALYLSGEDGERAESLLQQGRALPLADFSNLSAWYLANLYLRRGQTVQAIGVLEELSRRPDASGARAAALLEQLRSEARNDDGATPDPSGTVRPAGYRHHLREGPCGGARRRLPLPVPARLRQRGRLPAVPSGGLQL